MRWSARNIFIFIILLGVASFVGKNLGRLSGEAVNARDKAQGISQIVAEPVRTTVSVQASEGYTQASMDDEFLTKIGNYIFSEWKNKTFAYATKNRLPINQTTFTYDSIYNFAGSKKLAVIRLKMNGIANNIMVIGFVGNELRRVTCSSVIIVDLSVTDGPCDEKISQIFGSSINPFKS